MQRFSAPRSPLSYELLRVAFSMSNFIARPTQIYFLTFAIDTRRIRSLHYPNSSIIRCRIKNSPRIDHIQCFYPPSIQSLTTSSTINLSPTLRIFIKQFSNQLCTGLTKNPRCLTKLTATWKRTTSDSDSDDLDLLWAVSHSLINLQPPLSSYLLGPISTIKL